MFLLATVLTLTAHSNYSTAQVHQPVALAQQSAYSSATSMVQSAYPPPPPHIPQVAGGYSTIAQAQQGVFPTISPGQQGYPTSAPQAPGYGGPQLAQIHVPHVARATRGTVCD